MGNNSASTKGRQQNGRMQDFNELDVSSSDLGKRKGRSKSATYREIQTVIILKPNVIVPILDANLYAQREAITNRDLT